MTQGPIKKKNSTEDWPILYSSYNIRQCCGYCARVGYINGYALKPRISKIHNVQETQKTVSK